MRSTLPLAFGLAVLLLATSAWSQARIDRRALDELSPPAETSPAAPKPAERPQQQRTQRTPPATTPPAPPSAPAPTMPDAPDPPPVLAPAAEVAPAALEPPSAPAPLMPFAPPAPPVIPPPLAVPTRPVPPPPVVEVVPDAQGSATKTDDGWRITFGPGKSDLNPAMVQALRILARALPAQASVTVSAFAPGTPEDPSSSRRLSLSRGLAVRGVLITEGLVSTRITVRALGASPAIAAGPPDRADLVVSSPPTTSSPALATPAP